MLLCEKLLSSCLGHIILDKLTLVKLSLKIISVSKICQTNLQTQILLQLLRKWQAFWYLDYNPRHSLPKIGLHWLTHIELGLWMPSVLNIHSKAPFLGNQNLCKLLTNKTPQLKLGFPKTSRPKISSSIIFVHRCAFAGAAGAAGAAIGTAVSGIGAVGGSAAGAAGGSVCVATSATLDGPTEFLDAKKLGKLQVGSWRWKETNLLVVGKF